MGLRIHTGKTATKRNPIQAFINKHTNLSTSTSPVHSLPKSPHSHTPTLLTCTACPHQGVLGQILTPSFSSMNDCKQALSNFCSSTGRGIRSSWTWRIRGRLKFKQLFEFDLNRACLMCHGAYAACLEKFVPNLSKLCFP